MHAQSTHPAPDRRCFSLNALAAAGAVQAQDWPKQTTHGAEVVTMTPAEPTIFFEPERKQRAAVVAQGGLESE